MKNIWERIYNFFKRCSIELTATCALVLLTSAIYKKKEGEEEANQKSIEKIIGSNHQSILCVRVVSCVSESKKKGGVEEGKERRNERSKEGRKEGRKEDFAPPS